MPIDDSWLRDTGPIVVTGPTAAGPASTSCSTAGASKYAPYDRRRRPRRARWPAASGEVALRGADSCSRAGRSPSTARARWSPPSSACSTPTATPTSTASRDRGRGCATYLGVERVIWLAVRPGRRRRHRRPRRQRRRVRRARAWCWSRGATTRRSPTTSARRSTRRCLDGALDAGGPRPRGDRGAGAAHVDDRRARRAPVPYLNLYVANGAVVVPSVGAPGRRRRAGDHRATAYPDREVVPVPARCWPTAAAACTASPSRCRCRASVDHRHRAGARLAGARRAVAPARRCASAPCRTAGTPTPTSTGPRSPRASCSPPATARGWCACRS